MASTNPYAAYAASRRDAPLSAASAAVAVGFSADPSPAASISNHDGTLIFFPNSAGPSKRTNVLIVRALYAPETLSTIAEVHRIAESQPRIGNVWSL